MTKQSHQSAKQPKKSPGAMSPDVAEFLHMLNELEVRPLARQATASGQ